MDPKRVAFPGVDELLPAEIGTIRAAFPTPALPTDGANCRGVTMANLMLELLGFSK